MFDAPLAMQHQERERTLMERPASTTYEALVPLADGAKRQMLYNKVSFVDQRGEVAGLIGVITDVTHYKETERALEASEARFRVLTESSIDLISVTEENGVLRYQSAALRHLLGYDPADTVGRSVQDLVHRDRTSDGDRPRRPRHRLWNLEAGDLALKLRDPGEGRRASWLARERRGPWHHVAASHSPAAS